MAIGGLRKLREQGLRVPDDVSVAGFDDVDAGRFCEVPLTTARFDIRQLGDTAVRQVIEYLEKDDDTAGRLASETVLEPTLVVRQSTGPVSRPGRSRR
jgi:LacI family repressor for deo operon, udp, cdd, tsx, nupC, and nupG